VHRSSSSSTQQNHNGTVQVVARIHEDCVDPAVVQGLLYHANTYLQLSSHPSRKRTASLCQGWKKITPKLKRFPDCIIARSEAAGSPGSLTFEEVKLADLEVDVDIVATAVEQRRQRGLFDKELSVQEQEARRNVVLPQDLVRSQQESGVGDAVYESVYHFEVTGEADEEEYEDLENTDDDLDLLTS